MSTLIKHNSTPQFREVLKNIQHWANRHGKTAPTLIMGGSVKLHGTNAAVVFTGDFCETHHTQSRERIITPESDNAGFSAFINGNPTILEELRDIALRARKMFGGTDPIQIIGEWAGPGIQKGVGIGEIAEKMFFVFRIRSSTTTDSFNWTVPNHQLMDGRLHGANGTSRVRALNAMYYQPVVVNFDMPAEGVNQMEALTRDVDAVCPVAQHLMTQQNRPQTILHGEGWVWSVVGYVNERGIGMTVPYGDPGPFEGLDLRGIFWKTKGEAHTSSKVRTLVPMDVEKQQSIAQFIEYAVTPNRLNQGIEELKAMGKPIDRTSTGDFIGWVCKDVVKEELATMQASGIEPKAVAGKVAAKARAYYMEQI